jgi:tRNA pseudouridine55 synthase
VTVTREECTGALLLIDKNVGVTSFGVIGQLRKIIGERRIGHAGTLDKAASGLLVVCTGWSTRLSRYLLESDKRYSGMITLGVETDSCDSEGKVVSRHTITGITEAAVRKAVASFEGEIMQRPPEYSALKIEGRRASDRIRRGETVEMKERPVVIRAIVLTGFNPDEGTITVDVTCSKGTYIRSLARDIGRSLGCGAHLSALRRTASGVFSIEDAVTVDELTRILEGGSTDRRFLRSPREACTGMGVMTLNADGVGKALHGAFFTAEEVLHTEVKGNSPFTVEDERKNLIAIAQVDIDNWSVNYLNVFN